jgi:hypothetical protein
MISFMISLVPLADETAADAFSAHPKDRITLGRFGERAGFGQAQHRADEPQEDRCSVQADGGQQAVRQGGQRPQRKRAVLFAGLGKDLLVLVKAGKKSEVSSQSC